MKIYENNWKLLIFAKFIAKQLYLRVDSNYLSLLWCKIIVYKFSLLQRVHLEILVGEHANDYAQIAAKDKLTELQLRMRQLLDQIDQITKEQAYQRVWILLFIIYFHYNV